PSRRPRTRSRWAASSSPSRPSSSAPWRSRCAGGTAEMRAGFARGRLAALLLVLLQIVPAFAAGHHSEDPSSGEVNPPFPTPEPPPDTPQQPPPPSTNFNRLQDQLNNTTVGVALVDGLRSYALAQEYAAVQN